MEADLIKSLQLLKKSTGWTKDKEIKKSIEEKLKILKPKGQENPNIGNDATEFMEPFLLALDSPTIGCRIQSMIQIGEIITEGYYNGSKTLPDEKTKTEIEDICERLTTSCLSLNDESVSAQVIETISVIISSGKVHIHGYKLHGFVCQLFEVYFNLVKEENSTRAWTAISNLFGFVFERLNDADKDYVKVHGNEEEKNGDSTSAADLVSAIKQDFVPDVKMCMYDAVVKSLKYKFSIDTMRKGSVIEVTHNVSIGNSEEDDEDKDLIAKLPTEWHRDAFILLRLLAKYTVTPIDEPNGTQFRQSAYLLLEEQSGKGEYAINRLDAFSQCFRKYLFKSILMNLLGQDENIVKSTLDFFIVIADKFKLKLLPEIEVFISSVFIPLLNSDNTPFDHKMKVYL